MVIKDKKVPFNDRKTVESYLSSMKAGEEC